MQTFEEIIIEICEKIEINSSSIQHPNYPSFELSFEITLRFEQVLPQMQSDLIKAQLKTYLYDIYFDHSLMSNEQIRSSSQKQILVHNNIIDGIDIEFRQQLEKSNTSKGYFDPNWRVVAEASHGELVVVKDGLNLYIDRDFHLPKNSQPININDLVSVYLPNSSIGQDTYIMLSNLGSPDRLDAIELYFNFTPDAAVSIAASLTHQLNQLNIPFQFTILHNPELFYRTDSGVLLLSKSGYLAAQNTITQIYQAHHTEFSPEIPLGTQRLAPGLGLAEVPTTFNNCGMQLCELIATGLLSAIVQGKISVAEKFAEIRQQFAIAEIDWLQPDLNPLT